MTTRNYRDYHRLRCTGNKYIHFLEHHFHPDNLVKVIRSGMDLGWFSQVEVRRDKVLLHNPLFGDLYLSPKDRLLVFLRDLFDSIAYGNVRNSRYQDLGWDKLERKVRIYPNELIIPDSTVFRVHTITLSRVARAKDERFVTTSREDGRLVILPTFGQMLETPAVVTVIKGHQDPGSRKEIKWVDAQFYAIDISHFYRPSASDLESRIPRG